MRAVSPSVAVALIALALSSTAVRAAQRPPTPNASAPSTILLINLNTATMAELESLPGIGTRTAERIIEHRQKNGSFKKIEELMNVRGVGEKSFLKLKPLITVTPSKTEAAEQPVRH
jgi:competence protein ComEA